MNNDIKYKRNYHNYSYSDFYDVVDSVILNTFFYKYRDSITKNRNVLGIVRGRLANFLYDKYSLDEMMANISTLMIILDRALAFRTHEYSIIIEARLLSLAEGFIEIASYQYEKIKPICKFPRSFEQKRIMNEEKDALNKIMNIKTR